MSYIKTNVLKPGSNAGTGIKPKSAITLIDVEDILSFAQRDSKGVLITGPIVLKPNAYAITVYATQDTIELASNSEGETDNEGFMPSIKFKHPGNEQEIREYKAAAIGRQFVVMADYCDGKPKDLIGSPCNPVKMQVNYSANKDANGNEFTFQQMMRGDDIAMYTNTVPYAEPKAIVPADATSISLIGEGQYQLVGGATSVEIVGATGATDGLVFSLLGVKSETAPSITASDVFILKNGETWNGVSGSQITFKAIKSGVSSFIFIEISRA